LPLPVYACHQMFHAGVHGLSQRLRWHRGQEVGIDHPTLTGTGYEEKVVIVLQMPRHPRPVLPYQTSPLSRMNLHLKIPTTLLPFLRK
jgi:hypothetical protein